jgi:DNA adenine methylase
MPFSTWTPPYVGSDRWHYDGYTQEDFDALLEILADLKGKFLLSSFRNKTLAEFSKYHNWENIEFKMTCSMSSQYKVTRNKIEVLTANYPILTGENSPQEE